MTESIAIHIETSNLSDTHRLGRLLGEMTFAGANFLVEGDLGAGKTTFAQGIGRGLGIAESVAINSPTFTILNEYEGKRLFLHGDLYRLADASETWELGLDDYYKSDAVCYIEWASLFPSAYPSEYAEVSITILSEDARRFSFQSSLEAYQVLLKSLSQAFHQ